jgi:SAM-dependent methyltransferase
VEARVSFDGQAPAYEARAGLPEEICREVAALLLDGARGLVVDVGAGTGTLGRHLVAAGAPYVGIDLSRPMLMEFLRADGRARLLQADADGRWPIAGGAAGVILFSRSAHLLKSERTLDEVARVAAPGARVMVGRVRRARESAGERLKRAMQEMLRERALPGKNGERARRDFLDALERRGARRLPERASAVWWEEEAPGESLASWRGKSGLAGRVIPDAMKAEILAELERWAADELGDLARPRAVEQRYEVEGVQLGD